VVAHHPAVLLNARFRTRAQDEARKVLGDIQIFAGCPRRKESVPVFITSHKGLEIWGSPKLDYLGRAHPNMLPRRKEIYSRVAYPKVKQVVRKFHRGSGGCLAELDKAVDCKDVWGLGFGGCLAELGQAVDRTDVSRAEIQSPKP
jgi:hypothetical protein